MTPNSTYQYYFEVGKEVYFIDEIYNLKKRTHHYVAHFNM